MLRRYYYSLCYKYSILSGTCDFNSLLADHFVLNAGPWANGREWMHRRTLVSQLADARKVRSRLFWPSQILQVTKINIHACHACKSAHKKARMYGLEIKRRDLDLQLLLSNILARTDRVHLEFPMYRFNNCATDHRPRTNGPTDQDCRKQEAREVVGDWPSGMRR